MIASASKPCSRILTAPAMVRRLLMEACLRHRYGYAVAFTIMAVRRPAPRSAPICSATVINRAYVHRDFRALLLIARQRSRIFALKGAADLRDQVIMMQIGNRIIADKSAAHVRQAAAPEHRIFSPIVIPPSSRRAAATGAARPAILMNLPFSALGRDAGLDRPCRRHGGPGSGHGARSCWWSLPPALVVLRKLVRRIHAIAEGAVHRRQSRPSRRSRRPCRGYGS